MTAVAGGGREGDRKKCHSQQGSDPHCPSVVGSSGFVEPRWSGNTMWRMALRPTALSGGSWGSCLGSPWARGGWRGWW